MFKESWRNFLCMQSFCYRVTKIRILLGFQKSPMYYSRINTSLFENLGKLFRKSLEGR